MRYVKEFIHSFLFYKNNSLLEQLNEKGYSEDDKLEFLRNKAVNCNLCHFGRREVKPVVPEFHRDITAYFSSLFPGYAGENTRKSRSSMYIETIKRRYLGALGLPSREVCFSSCVYCTVRSANDITSEVLNRCWNWKTLELSLINPSVYFLMDLTSMNQFSWYRVYSINFIGKIYSITIEDSFKEVLVVPIAHPIMTMRSCFVGGFS